MKHLFNLLMLTGTITSAANASGLNNLSHSNHLNLNNDQLQMQSEDLSISNMLLRDRQIELRTVREHSRSQQTAGQTRRIIEAMYTVNYYQTRAIEAQQNYISAITFGRNMPTHASRTTDENTRHMEEHTISGTQSQENLRLMRALQRTSEDQEQFIRELDTQIFNLSPMNEEEMILFDEFIQTRITSTANWIDGINAEIRARVRR